MFAAMSLPFFSLPLLPFLFSLLISLCHTPACVMAALSAAKELAAATTAGATPAATAALATRLQRCHGLALLTLSPTASGRGLCASTALPRGAAVLVELPAASIELPAQLSGPPEAATTQLVSALLKQSSHVVEAALAALLPRGPMPLEMARSSQWRSQAVALRNSLTAAQRAWLLPLARQLRAAEEKKEEEETEAGPGASSVEAVGQSLETTAIDESARDGTAQQHADGGTTGRSAVDVKVAIRAERRRRNERRRRKKNDRREGSDLDEHVLVLISLLFEIHPLASFPVRAN